MTETKLSTKPYKGTRDFYPESMRIQNFLFDTLRKVAERYAYEAYDGPMLESFELYAAKTSEEIVNEQLYSFEDRGKRKVVIRPEMTPTLARMVAAKGHELPKPIRWYSIPNLWRYERPQKGRLREHWQLNVDILGVDDTQAELEILQVAIDVLRAFGADHQHFEVQINHRELMNDFFTQCLKLDPEQYAPVSRALDKRAKLPPEKFEEQLQEAGCAAEQIQLIDRFLNSALEELKDLLPDSPGLEKLRGLFADLAALDLSEYCVFSPAIMRGFDYYTGTVFEIFDRSPENRRSLFGGGRYDNLVGLFGKQKIPGVGFGMGDVTLRDFVSTHGLLPELQSNTDVFVALFSKEMGTASYKLAQELREQGLNVANSMTAGKLGKQFQAADKKGIPWVVMIGPEELEKGEVVLKNLTTGEQETRSRKDIVEKLKNS